MAEQIKSIPKKWSKEEVLGLLRCYAARREEFSHPRKQKIAYENVLEEMIYQGITNTLTTALSLQSKIKSLLSSYKDAKDDRKKTGAAPIIIVPYLNELDEIFGDKPILSNMHTIHLGRKQTTDEEQPSTSAFALKTITQTITQQTETSQKFINFEALDEEGIQMSPITLMNPMSSKTPPTPLTSTSSTRILHHSRTEQRILHYSINISKVPKRKTAKEKYFEEKLKIKKEASNVEQEQRADFFKSIQEGLKEKLNKESEYNKMRIEILKSIQNSLPN